MFRLIELDVPSAGPQDPAIGAAVSAGHVAVLRGGGRVRSLADWWEICYQPEKSHQLRMQQYSPVIARQRMVRRSCGSELLHRKKQALAGGENFFYLLHRLISDLGAEAPHDQKLLHSRTAFEATEPFERPFNQSVWRLPKAA